MSEVLSHNEAWRRSEALVNEKQHIEAIISKKTHKHKLVMTTERAWMLLWIVFDFFWEKVSYFVVTMSLKTQAI